MAVFFIASLNLLQLPRLASKVKAWCCEEVRRMQQLLEFDVSWPSCKLRTIYLPASRYR